MSVGRFNAAILVRHAGVVAGGGHSIVARQLVIAAGEIELSLTIEVLERRRQRVGPMLAGGAPKLPQGILQALRKGAEALAAEDHVGMLPATVGQPEMVEAVGKGLAGDGHAKLVGDGEIRQALTSGIVPLGEEHLLVGAMKSSPVADPALQGAPRAVRHDLRSELVLQRLKDADRHQTGGSGEHLERARPDGDERVLPRPPRTLGLRLRRKPGILVELASGPLADAGHGGRGHLGVSSTFGHVKSRLWVGEVKAGHRARIGEEQMRAPYHPRRRQTAHRPPAKGAIRNPRPPGPVSGRGSAPPDD